MKRSTIKPTNEAPPYPIKDGPLKELGSKKLLDLIKEKKLGGPIPTTNLPPEIYRSPVFVKAKDLSRNKILFLIDFSSPLGDSINSAILKEHSYVEFPKILFWIRLAYLIGPTAWISIADLQNAYYNVRIMEKYHQLFAFTWEDLVFLPYYMPFGVATGCSTLQKLLDIIFRALEIVFPQIYMWNGKSLGTHYLDDACWIALCEMQAWYQVSIYYLIVTSIGLPIHPSKVQFPAKTGILLGFKLELQILLFSLKDGKAKKYLAIVNKQIKHFRKATIKESRSLIGKLRHAAKAINGAFVFVRSIEQQVLELLEAKYRLYRPYTYNKEALEDLKAWSQLLPLYNGLPFEFLARNKFDTTSVLITDASGNPKLGLGGWDSFGNWFSIPWSKTLLKKSELVLKNFNNILEFITVAVAILCPKQNSYKNQSIHVLCDNQTAVVWLIKKAPKFGTKYYGIIMHLLRKITLYCVKNHLFLWFDFISRKNNMRADALSKLKPNALSIPQNNPSVKNVSFKNDISPIKFVNSLDYFDHLAAVLIHSRLGAGSRRAYRVGTKFWLQFATVQKYHYFSNRARHYVNFAILRFLGHNNQSSTIKSNFAHINSYRVQNGHHPIKWSKHCWRLPYIYQLIDKMNPPGPVSLPNDAKFTLRLKKYYKIHLNNITQFAIWTSHLLAYCFALRISEYSETKDYYPPQLSAVTLAPTKYGNNSILYTIPKSKKHQTSRKPEVVQAMCCCPKICIYHSMVEYLRVRVAINDQIPKRHRKWLFVYKKKTKITINGRRVDSYQYAPLTATKVREYFYKNVEAEFGPNHGHKVHGWRAGGITDLICAGLSKETVSVLSRHAINSTAFQRYIRFTPEHVAHLIKTAKDDL